MKPEEKENEPEDGCTFVLLLAAGFDFVEAGAGSGFDLAGAVAGLISAGADSGAGLVVTATGSGCAADSFFVTGVEAIGAVGGDSEGVGLVPSLMVMGLFWGGGVELIRNRWN